MGNVVVGDSASASGMLTAKGGSVTVNAANSTDSAVFTLGGLSLPVTIPAGSSVSFTLTFNPNTTGIANATVIFNSNATTANISEALTGNGTPAPTHSVSLAWDASTSSDVAGYNVYRASYLGGCGAFAKINPTVNTSLLYLDGSVANGASYCYATTAVDSSNQESVYSNVVSNVQIPTT
jgi:hypothetical protein